MWFVGLLQYTVMWLVTGILAPLVILLAVLGRRSAAYRPIRLWCRALHLATGVRFTITGLDNVPPAGPYVIIANHCSHLDGPTLIVALPHPIYFVIKRELARIPLWGPATVKAGFLPIDRADSDRARAQMQAAVDSVTGGKVILVFPEGTRSRSDEMLPFKKGGFHLAVNAQVPIVPVAITGSRRLWPRGRLSPRPGRLHLAVAAPIATTGLGEEAVADLAATSRRVIQAMREELDPSLRSPTTG